MQAAASPAEAGRVVAPDCGIYTMGRTIVSAKKEDSRLRIARKDEDRLERLNIR
jgi:hypothetical protein